MPDNTPRDGIQEETIQKIPPSQPTPDNPKPQTAQGVSNASVEGAIHAVEDRVKRAEWLMIGLTSGIVLLTLGLVVVGILQWRVMSGQLGEMKSSSGQTDQLIDKTRILAENAGKQVQRMKDFADTMKDQAEQTKAIAKQAVVEAKATNDLAGAANRSAAASETSNKQTAEFFRLSNRPWVGVEGDVAFDEKGLMGVGGKPEIGIDSDGIVSKRVLYHLKNSGNSPALNTMLMVQQITFPQTSVVNYTQVFAMIETECKLAERAILQRNGDLVLPGVVQPVPYTFGGDQKAFLFAPGCIVYRDTDGKFHHTKICHAVALFLTPFPKGLETCMGQSAD